MPSCDSRTVQPAGSLTVAVVELVVRNATKVSPACTPAGMVTVWLVRLPAVLLVPTKLSAPAAALAGGAATASTLATTASSTEIHVTFRT